MKSISRFNIMFIVSIMFFVTGTYVNYNNIYKISINNNKPKELINSNITKDEEQKILDLFKTMDETIEYLNNNDASYETKKQLINNLSEAAEVINNKLNYKDNEFINEVNMEYYNLKDKSTIDIDRLSFKYEKWKQKIYQ